MDKIPISADKPTTGALIAQVVGLTAAAYVAGAQASLTVCTIPAILQAPAPLLVKQWQIMYDTGKLALPPLAVGSGAIFGYLAYRSTPSSTPRSLYTAAAVLLPSIVPYTIFLLKPINDKLIAMATSLADTASEASVNGLETAHALVDRWGTLNLIRSLLPLTGAVLAAFAVADKYELMTLSSVTIKSGANRMG